MVLSTHNPVKILQPQCPAPLTMKNNILQVQSKGQPNPSDEDMIHKTPLKTAKDKTNPSPFGRPFCRTCMYVMFGKNLSCFDNNIYMQTGVILMFNLIALFFAE